ncbi:MAG: hypothetical protein QM516_12035 [Limnohabitans sp.]|nr:hypothetical protein [Limnohabitans sp.]
MLPGTSADIVHVPGATTISSGTPGHACATAALIDAACFGTWITLGQSPNAANTGDTAQATNNDDTTTESIDPIRISHSSKNSATNRKDSSVEA